MENYLGPVCRRVMAIIDGKEGCYTGMVDQEGFLAEVQDGVLRFPGVKRVEFYGSVLSNHFKPGHSDLDMVVEGRLANDTKLRIIELLRDADKKYAMGLETAPHLHPVPIFVPTTVGVLIRRGGLLRLFQLVEPLTRPLRRHAKEKPSMTLGEYWDGQRLGIDDHRFLLELLFGTRSRK